MQKKLLVATISKWLSQLIHSNLYIIVILLKPTLVPTFTTAKKVNDFALQSKQFSIILKDRQFEFVKWIHKQFNLIHKRNLNIPNAGLNAYS